MHNLYHIFSIYAFFPKNSFFNYIINISLFSVCLPLDRCPSFTLLHKTTDMYTLMRPVPAGTPEEKVAFMAALEKVGGANGTALKTVLDEKKGFKVLMFEDPAYPGLIVVMIMGYNDAMMVEAGRKHGLPRGFPIIWDRREPEETIRFGGFYPKFENDRDQESRGAKSKLSTSLADIARTKGDLEVGLKFSGYLSMLMCVGKLPDGGYLMLVTSKNSASVQMSGHNVKCPDAQRIWSTVLDNCQAEFFEEMLERKLTMAAEMMSKEDQVHGTQVHNELPVVTCISCPTQERFVAYFTTTEREEFLLRHGIPCPGRIIIPQRKVVEFVSRIADPSSRDFMDLHVLAQILTKLGIDTGRKVAPDTFGPGMCSVQMYRQTMGDVLEGLVLFATVGVVKFKLPGYTWRTMWLRSNLCAMEKGTGRLMDAKTFSTRSYGPTTPDGIAYYSELYRLATECLKETTDDGKVARHIVMADKAVRIEAMSHVQAQPQPQPSVEEVTASVGQIDLAKEKPSIPVVVVVGPIGHGKTTVAEKLGQVMKGVSVIDGDTLYGTTSQETMTFGKERNEATMWAVNAAIARGEVPVISTGGGALFTQRSNFVKHIAKAFGVSTARIEVILIQPDNLDVYNDTHKVVDAIKWRVESGKWQCTTVAGKKRSIIARPNKAQVEAFANFIAGCSRRNAQFPVKIAETVKASGARLRLVELVADGGNFGCYCMKSLPSLAETISGIPSDLPAPKVWQDRLLVTYNGRVYHITLAYNKDEPQPQLLPNWRDTTLECLMLKYSNGSRCLVPVDHVSAGLPPYAHVTLEAKAPHKPADMRAMTETYRGLPVSKPTTTTFDPDDILVVGAPQTIRVVAAYALLK